MSGIIGGSGRKTGVIGIDIQPSQPAFSASASYTNIELSDSKIMALSGERFDTGDNLDTNTFVAPVTGIYLFTYMFYFTSMDADHTLMDIHILTSNKQYQQTWEPNRLFSADTKFSVSSTIIADMDVNDTCVFKVYLVAGDAQTDLHSDSQVSGCLLH